MEQIKILFFALASFFGIEDGRIASEKTTITLYPDLREIEVIQEELFTVIQTEKDSILIVEQWNKICDSKSGKTVWSKELDSFPVKNFSLLPIKNKIQPHLKLKYSQEKDLYNKKKKQFSINNIPQHNIKTSDGQLEKNYWVFSAKDTITFTIEPFLQMPENYK